jgi:N-acyl-D-amino-acid deacylase
VLGSTEHEQNKQFQGKPLPEVANKLGVEPVDAVLHLTETDELKTSAFFSGMSEDNMMRILAMPYVMLGSDASLRAPSGPLSHDFPHPRAYGSFTRYLQMAIQGQTVDLSEAIRKITSLPADQFGLRSRGRIAKDYAADIAIIDTNRLRENTSYASPHNLSDGVDTLVVNGVITMAQGKLTGERAGRML